MTNGGRRRRNAALPSEGGVRRYDSNLPYPVVVDVGDDPARWITENQAAIDRHVGASGALLIRPRKLIQRSLLEVYNETCGLPTGSYVDQHTPRRQISNSIYTSTEYPSELDIPFHSENSKNSSWPHRIAFYCEIAARFGGETGLADNGLVLRSLPEQVIAPFEKWGVRYVRNFHDGLGVPWRKAFGVETLDELRLACASQGFELSQTGPNTITISHVRPAFAEHRLTGERLWFNQAQLFHPAALPTLVRTQLLAFGPESSFPSYATYGDGSPIADDTIELIADAFRRHAVQVSWRAGDLLIVDNIKLAHARRAFEGERRVFVSMFHPA
jgi:hypothetical protein